MALFRPIVSGELHAEKGNRKKVKDFELTLARCALSKAHVFFALEDLCDVLVVSEEQHADQTPHLHCYLRLHIKEHIDTLRLTIGNNIFGDPDEFTWGSIHISTLRNWKHWVKYITKEDVSPISKNIDESLFHQAWKIHHFITSNELFDPMHAFVRQNPSLTNILQRTHADYWAKHALKQWRSDVTFSSVEPNLAVSWVNQVTDLFWKRRHIYLYGPTGLGKSVLGNYLLTQAQAACVLPSGNTAWEFGCLRACDSLAVAGDADSAYVACHRQTLLRLCDRAPVALNQKCGSFRTVVFTGVILIISNFEPPADEAFLRRFTVVFADQYGVIPKEKVCCKIEDDAQSISSHSTPIYVSSESSDLPSLPSW